MTEVYIIRHSIPYRDNLDVYNAKESTQISNEKNILSIEGEMLAKKLSDINELNGIDAVYSSHYVRAMSTAKYIAYNNNILLNVDERLGERRFGNVKIKDLPEDYYERQFKDQNYKLDGGECLNEVNIRMNDILNELLYKYKDKRIAIVSHGTALTFMLKNYCTLKWNEIDEFLEIYFNNKLVFDGKWDCPEIFKLIFDGNKLISIENIKWR